MVQDFLKPKQLHISLITKFADKRTKAAILEYDWLYSCKGDLYYILNAACKGRRPRNCGHITVKRILTLIHAEIMLDWAAKGEDSK